MDNTTKPIDLTGFEFAQHPFQYYDELRKTGNVHYLESTNSWLIIGYQEIVTILSNYQLFSSAGDHPFDPILLNCDPPNHTKHKKILAGDGGMFANKRVSNLELQNREIFQRIIEPLKNKVEVDLMADIAMPFSTLVILNLLGIKPDSVQELKEWSTNVVLSKSIYDTNFSGKQWDKLKPMVQRWIDKARHEDSTFGIASLLLNKEVDFTDEERLLDLTKVLLLGGNETTPNLVTSALLILYRNKPLLNEIKNQPQLLENLIQETLRLEAPTQIIQRTSKTEVEVGGVKIPANANISLAIGAANRDPAVFENPNQFDLNRTSGKILSFGYGPHYCIGATLAKQEAQIALEVILEEFPHAALNASFKRIYKHSSHVRGLQSMPIYTNGLWVERLALLKQQAVSLLEATMEKYQHFATVEQYPQIDEVAWHYTYPSPFIHANVLYSLISCKQPAYAQLIANGVQFLVDTKETSNTWRFWHINNCHNPVPPDVDDTAICSWVLLNQKKISHHESIILNNINNQGAIYTWFTPTIHLLLKSPRFFMRLLFENSKVKNTLNAGMLHPDDVELGVMANALLLLGQTPKTEKTIALCIALWKKQNDNHYFYDNKLVIAYHIARAFYNGVSGFEVLKDDMHVFLKQELVKATTTDYLLIYLTAAYFNIPDIKEEAKVKIMRLIEHGEMHVEPYRYFTSKDRNFYGGSACLTAAWFLEVTRDW